jgi:drug/metabolite transporter (DMT)-like permease
MRLFAFRNPEVLMRSHHLVAVSQALFVTFLWSTSWVLIKIGLDDIPALVFAGMRYSLAFLILLLYALQRRNIRHELTSLSRRDWLWFILLGFIFYTVTQGAQFLALSYLPAVTLSLLLNFSAVVVALMGILWLAEYPRRVQWIGIGVFLSGVIVYFHPVNIPAREVVGLLIAVVGTLANATGGIIGRYVNRQATVPVLLITLISMGTGSLVLLVAGFTLQGLPTMDATSWLIVIWLAVVNTAFAFTLWNHTLRTLSAVESSIINNTMLVQIALLAWIFLGERLSVQEVVGLVLAAVGILVVQVGGRRRK